MDWGIVTLVLLALTGCGSPPAPVLGPPPSIPIPTDSGGITEHVIVISMDGLRPDAITRFGPPMLTRLVEEGSHTLEATTIVPSRTLPAHMSMVSGEYPIVHGVINNEDPDETRWEVNVTTMFSEATNRGLVAAAFHGKKKFRQIHEPAAVEYEEIPTNWLGLRPAWVTARRVEDYLTRARPNLLFIHFAEPDYIGHAFYWMSPVYRWAVGWTDRAVSRVLAAADEAFGVGHYTVLLTADHGGSRFSHGSADPVDVTIPWIAWGRGVLCGVELPPGVRVMDTAATAVWLLGIPVPPDWEGAPVLEAFRRSSREPDDAPILGCTPARARGEGPS